jgi:signal transduction histidine kinase
MAVFALEEDLKHFGNLLKLILDVSEFHYLQHQSQKIYQYHGKDKIIVPLIIRDKTIGVLGLVMSSEQRFFDETSLAYAIEIAKRTSLAIEHVQLYQELQKAIEQRDEFISIASHELKTPITSMKLQYQLIERGLRRDNPQTVDSSVVMKMVDRSNKQLSRITRLVEDMLDISRITSGKLELTLKKTNITELIRDVVHDLSHVLEHLPELIELDLEEGVEAICDEYRIEQVIANLVTNAIRYGNETPIGVKLKKINDIISISVTDHGPGISVENQKRIFEKYERATSKNISGLGLGLFIGQEIIRQHKGTLTVHSDPGKGATFKVTFPANLK